RATCDYEPKSVCANILPTKMEVYSSYLSANLSVLVALLAVVTLCLTLTSMLVMGVTKVAKRKSVSSKDVEKAVEDLTRVV
ncbi:hypothetical protein KIPB_011281, partial [Kipferlia bialata]